MRGEPCKFYVLGISKAASNLADPEARRGGLRSVSSSSWFQPSLLAWQPPDPHLLQIPLLSSRNADHTASRCSCLRGLRPACPKGKSLDFTPSDSPACRKNVPNIHTHTFLIMWISCLKLLHHGKNPRKPRLVGAWVICDLIPWSTIMTLTFQTSHSRQP